MWELKHEAGVISFETEDILQQVDLDFERREPLQLGQMDHTSHRRLRQLCAVHLRDGLREALPSRLHEWTASLNYPDSPGCLPDSRRLRKSDAHHHSAQ